MCTLAFDHFYTPGLLSTLCYALFTRLLPQKVDRHRQRVKNSVRRKKHKVDYAGNSNNYSVSFSEELLR